VPDVANLNRVLLIGRLTRDPEIKTFNSGSAVVKFGFAVNNRKKNQQTGEWEDEPVFLECEAWDRANGAGQGMASRINDTLTKGKQIFIEGRLKFEQWESQEGGKRSKLLVSIENFQYLEPKEGGGGDWSGAPRGNTGRRPAPARKDDDPFRPDGEEPGVPADDEIPF
jgi:single-strand DNA-binding protein